MSAPEGGRDWIGPAGEALQLAVDGDYPAAAKVIEKMAADFGAGVVQAAMLAWIDTALHSAGVKDYGQRVRLGFIAAETGKIDFDADAVRPEAVCAGRLIAARLADDESTFRALLAAVPNDPRIVGDHVMEVLSSAALTIKGESRLFGGAL